LAKIIFVFAQNDLGGHTKVVLNLCKELDKMGHKCTVYVPFLTHFFYTRQIRKVSFFSFGFVRYLLSQAKSEIQVRRLRWNGTKMGIYNPPIKRYFSLPQIKVLDDYDVIVTSSHWQISELRYVGFKRDNIINIIHHPHTSDAKVLDRVFLNSNHINIAASISTSNKCKKLGIKINKMIYTGGVDREIFKFSNKRLSNNVGFFYYNHPRKMPEFTRAVIDLLLTKKPNLEILVFGNGYKNQGVTVFERLKEIDYAAAISQVGLFVYISSEEGFGLPPLEAMAAGIPVLSCKVGAVTEYGKESIEFIDSTLSPEQVAFKILNLVNDKDLRIKLGTTGNRYSNKWNWRTCAENYDLMIRRILEGKNN